MTDSIEHSFTVDQTPDEAFAAITDPRAWWSEGIVGKTDELGAEFIYRYKDMHYSKHRVAALVPGERVVWRVLESHLSFVDDRTEWDGTEVTFDIARKGDKTEVRFRHLGLGPKQACFDRCSSAWRSYVTGSLRKLIAEGKGAPDVSAKA